ncbi:MAG: hypothetical protein AAFZ18_11055 [Myxococcota bacterium]
MIRRVALAILLFGFAASPAFATVVVPVTVEQMARQARCVVRAKVQGSSSAWDEGHRRIHTLTEIEVLEVLAGPPMERATIRTLGGEVGAVGMKVSGAPHFATGEEVILFLTEDRTDVRRFQVMGLSQGKYVVDRSGASPRAVPSSHGLVYAVRDGRGGLQVDPSARGPAPMGLAHLSSRVRAAASGQPTLTTPATPAPTPPILDGD